MEKYFSNTSLMMIFWKWKWHLIIVAVVAIVLGAVFSSSLFITPKYASRAVIYPSNVAPYSDENETEQLLQWFQSRDIKDSLIARFDLDEHYAISKDYKYYYTTMLYLYSKNVSISKTPYEAIEIEVQDKDPQKAKEMVDALIELLNNKIYRIQKAKFDEVLEINAFMLKRKQKELDSVMNVLAVLGEEYGLYDVQSQALEVTEGYLRTIDGNAARINQQGVNKLKKSLEEKGGKFLIYSSYVGSLVARYGDVVQEYNRAYKDANKKFSYTNTVTEPFVADKKAYPVRWLIVAYTLIAALLMFTIVVAIVENKKSMELIKEKN